MKISKKKAIWCDFVGMKICKKSIAMTSNNRTCRNWRQTQEKQWKLTLCIAAFILWNKFLM